MESSLGIKNCLPGDISLCLLLSPEKNVPLKKIKIDLAYNPPDFSICEVSGFPIKPLDLKYSYPYSELPSEGLESKVNSTFNNFSTITLSKGKIKSVINNLVEIKCSTTNGMSGGQLYVKNIF